jgi:hypothetical protein
VLRASLESYWAHLNLTVSRDGKDLWEPDSSFFSSHFLRVLQGALRRYWALADLADVSCLAPVAIHPYRAILRLPEEEDGDGH